jgi:hypothetical protein
MTLALIALAHTALRALTSRHAEPYAESGGSTPGERSASALLARPAERRAQLIFGCVEDAASLRGQVLAGPIQV